MNLNAKRPLAGGLGAAAGVAALAADSAQAAALPADDVQALIKTLPSDFPTAQSVCQKLIGGGKQTIVLLVELVGDEFGDAAGSQAKYALHGLVHYASRPGADAERDLVARTLAGRLQADHSDELKAFVVRQLQLCGREQEVPALAELLQSERLCEPAAQALAAIGGRQAEAALKSAQSGASDGRRSSIAHALAQLQGK